MRRESLHDSLVQRASFRGIAPASSRIVDDEARRTRANLGGSDRRYDRRSARVLTWLSATNTRLHTQTNTGKLGYNGKRRHTGFSFALPRPTIFIGHRRGRREAVPPAPCCGPAASGTGWSYLWQATARSETRTASNGESRTFHRPLGPRPTRLATGSRSRQHGWNVGCRLCRRIGTRQHFIVSSRCVASRRRRNEIIR